MSDIHCTYKHSIPTDTPGVHLHHRLAHMLTPEELKSLHPRKTLRVYVPPTPLDISQLVEEEEESEEMPEKKGERMHSNDLEPQIAPDSSIKVSSVAWDADDEALLAMFAPLASESSLDAASASAALGRSIDKSKSSTKRTTQRSTSWSAPRANVAAQSVTATYLWGGIARLDILEAPPQTALAFYGPPCLHVEPLPLLEEDDLVELDHHAEDDGMVV